MHLVEHAGWKIVTVFHKYAGDIDEYTARFGKEEGEKRFIRDHRPYDVYRHPGNLLMSAGVILLWDLAIGSSTATFANGTAQIAVGDGQVSATPGTVATTSGSTTLTGTGTAFTTYLTAGQTILVGSTVYTIAAGGVVSNTSLTVTTAASATASGLMWTPGPVASQTALSAYVNSAFGAMTSGYPSTSTPNVINFQASFGSSVADFTWNEWAIFNKTPSGIMLNRAVGFAGVKASGSTWLVTSSATLS